MIAGNLIMRIIGFIGILVMCFSCTPQENLSPFVAIPATQSNITFTNQVEDTPEFNILDYLYFYNGGGVATGDLNNDGLPDVFFTSNLGADQLYFNRGDFQFDAANELFDAQDLEGWSSGVTFVDINADGWLDIYVCKLGDYGPYKNHNKLFINQKGKKFVESAANYGLDFSGFATQAAFFDFDRDGDLDCYLLNHSVKNPEQFRPSAIRQQVDSLAGDVLLECINGRYEPITASAGIYRSSVGFGLGIDIVDVNNDHWPDIYVGNDFHENDYLYLNQKDKTFKEVIAQATGHTSNFSMGCAIADLNNDLQPDILSLDMKPDDEYIYKKSGGWETIEIYNYKRKFGYHHQSPRNALQINLGLKNGIPQFSEQAALFDMEATDWSWSPLIFDFDNDGDKDVFITNGIVRRPNDMDFVNFEFDAQNPDKLSQVHKMPSGQVANCYFQNQPLTHTFSKREIGPKGISTGAAVADFDRDGRLDIAINNINAPATILKNNSDQLKQNFLSIKLEDQTSNKFGIGASIFLYQGAHVQLNHIKSSAGFQSFSEPIAHFGAVDAPVDSIKIIWPDGLCQIERVDQLNKSYTFQKQKNSQPINGVTPDSRPIQRVAAYQHQRLERNDQQAHKWLLYNQSNNGPKMIPLSHNEIYLTGNSNTPSGVVNVTTDEFYPVNDSTNRGNETDACLIENQSQQNKLLYVAKAMTEQDAKKNMGGDYVLAFDETNELLSILPAGRWSATNSTVASSCDYDKDGDADIFVGVNSMAGNYGSADSSVLLLNEQGKLVPGNLPLAGMVYDAQWSDLDGNGFDDLIVVGHWMPITIFYNTGSELVKFQIPKSNGLWFCVKVYDVDQDGQKDILAGNYGLNHSLTASIDAPMRFYQNDFDKNGQQETLVTYTKEHVEVPYPNQGLFAAQIPAVKKKYLKNTDYATAKIDELVAPKLLQAAKQGQLFTLSSTCFLQQRDNNWQSQALPHGLQTAPIFAIEKGFEDHLFFGGNFHDVDPNWGRQDASYLSAYLYQDGLWVDHSDHLKLPMVGGAIRDLHYQNQKLYIAKNDDYLEIINFAN